MRLAALLLGVLILSGCASPASAPHVHAPPTAAATDVGLIAPDIYLTLMRKLSDFTSSSDDDLIALAKATCQVVPTDNGWVILVKNYTDTGIDAGQSGAAIQYAVSAYCPDEEVNIPQ